jgi:hypothetical protein
MGCSRAPQPDAPLSVAPQAPEIKRLPSAFPPVLDGQGNWVEERLIGRSFAQQGDYYRAITAFKRSLILLPEESASRCFELQYDILLCYCFAQRWSDALSHYRSSELGQIPPDFPARRDLILLVQEILLQTGDSVGSEHMDRMLSPEDAKARQLSRSLQLRAWENVDSASFKELWTAHRKSPDRAAFLQAIFPGAGYWYVGQTRAGVTSFLLNALTTAATVTLATHHQWAAAFLVGSLELGWYMGGMNGAALAAHQWNQRLGEDLAYPLLMRERSATLFRLEYAF